MARSHGVPRPACFCFAAALASLTAVACNDSAAPTVANVIGRMDGPRFTVSSGVTNVTLVRANAGIVKANSFYNGFKSKFSTYDNADIVMNNNSMIAGGTSGWHTHPGITIVAIKSGALTLYDADDPLCPPKVYSAGQVFLEEGGHSHIARNEGSIGAEWYTTYVVPAGGPTRIDAPDPGTCPF